MNNLQIKNYFSKMEKTPCPHTDRLIAAGYRQKSGGYISYAKQMGISNPTQYWHLMESWSARSKDNQTFGKNITCGELIFWLAEVSNAVDKNTLNKLANTIIDNYLNNRKKGNQLIQQVCFEKIKFIVENY